MSSEYEQVSATWGKPLGWKNHMLVTPSVMACAWTSKLVKDKWCSLIHEAFDAAKKETFDGVVPESLHKMQIGKVNWLNGHKPVFPDFQHQQTKTLLVDKNLLIAFINPRPAFSIRLVHDNTDKVYSLIWAGGVDAKFELVWESPKLDVFEGAQSIALVIFKSWWSSDIGIEEAAIYHVDWQSVPLPKLWPKSQLDYSELDKQQAKQYIKGVKLKVLDLEKTMISKNGIEEDYLTWVDYTAPGVLQHQQLVNVLSKIKAKKQAVCEQSFKGFEAMSKEAAKNLGCGTDLFEMWLDDPVFVNKSKWLAEHPESSNFSGDLLEHPIVKKHQIEPNYSILQEKNAKQILQEKNAKQLKPLTAKEVEEALQKQEAKVLQEKNYKPLTAASLLLDDAEMKLIAALDPKENGLEKKHVADIKKAKKKAYQAKTLEEKLQLEKFNHGLLYQKDIQAGENQKLVDLPDSELEVAAEVTDEVSDEIKAVIKDMFKVEVRLVTYGINYKVYFHTRVPKHIQPDLLPTVSLSKTHGSCWYGLDKLHEHDYHASSFYTTEVKPYVLRVLRDIRANLLAAKLVTEEEVQELDALEFGVKEG